MFTFKIRRLDDISTNEVGRIVSQRSIFASAEVEREKDKHKIMC